MKLKTNLHVWAVGAALCLCGAVLMAQNDIGGRPGGGPGDAGGPPAGGFDPAQFRQRMMDQIRNNLAVTNDDEWTVIQPLIQKVMDARRESGNGGGMAIGVPGGGPGGPPPDRAPSRISAAGQTRDVNTGSSGGSARIGNRGWLGPQASEEQKALQKALDDNAPVSQVKEALAKYRAARKDKQAKLEAAQANLRDVLTPKQEGQAVLMGLLQ